MKLHPALAAVLAAGFIAALFPFITDTVAFIITPLNYLGLP